jgi:hypothetical protein
VSEYDKIPTIKNGACLFINPYQQDSGEPLHTIFHELFEGLNHALPPFLRRLDLNLRPKQFDRELTAVARGKGQGHKIKAARKRMILFFRAA